jgi:acetyl/propionyl-CoA carboxylase alpha subunit
LRRRRDERQRSSASSDLPAAARSLIKAVAGGGRGMRVVSAPAEFAAAWERCRSEAQASFCAEALYVERYLPNARAISKCRSSAMATQLSHLGRARMHHSAAALEDCRMARPAAACRRSSAKPCARIGPHGRPRCYQGLGTFEFVIPADGGSFVFIEANPRLQVEHTVSEEIYGIDLVKTQIRVAHPFGATGVVKQRVCYPESVRKRA